MDRSNFNPQVGDLVRVRLWEDMAKEFGIDEDGNIPCKFSFVGYMENYRWKLHRSSKRRRRIYIY